MTFRRDTTVQFEQQGCHGFANYYYYAHTFTLDISGIPKCNLEVDHQGKVCLRWEQGSRKPIEIASGTLRLNSTTDDTKRAVLKLQPGKFPPSACGSLIFEGLVKVESNKSCVEYRLDISMEFAKPGNINHLEYAQAFSASTKSRLPNDVCFFFPRTGRSLWANEIILSNASPYLSSLLTSGFSESISPKSSGGGKKPSVELKPFEFEDSDEERDKVRNVKHSPASEESNVKFKRVEITETTYTTYFNALCWIGTRYIEFAPLKSSKQFPSASTTSQSSPKKVTPSPSTKDKSSLPLPASPKSIYRLSHLLQLPELSKLALANFKYQLTPRNVAYELYTDVATAYPEIRDVALEYAVENWKEVVKSKAFSEVEQKAQTGEGVDAWTVMLLSKKLMKRWGK
ncbi:hypothetical protein JCM5350_007123 [Sporobolomyces pararoseus]